jgi:hypothetical protein
MKIFSKNEFKLVMLDKSESLDKLLYNNILAARLFSFSNFKKISVTGASVPANNSTKIPF